MPHDQFARCKEELAKLNHLVDEVTRSIDITDRIHTNDAQYNITLCRNDIETAGLWLGKAIKALERKP